MNAETKRYLGDAVYAEATSFDIVLTTSNGLEENGRIYLDREVLAALALFAVEHGLLRGDQLAALKAMAEAGR